MKKLMLSVAILGLCATMNEVNAQTVNVKNGQAPFVVKFSSLSSYLDLTSTQLEDVYNINEYFIMQQKESMNKSAKNQEAGLQKALYSNLKLMKGVLSDQQYRKYLTLLNVTNNNRR